MLTISESRRSNDVQKIFRFISDFSISLDNKYKAEHIKKSSKIDDESGETEDENEYVHPFLVSLFETLINVSKYAALIFSSFLLKVVPQIVFMLLISL